MSDDERPSDATGPDIDLERIADENDIEAPNGTDGGSTDDENAGERHGDEGPEGADGGHDDHGAQHDHEDHDESAGRTTAPQSEFSTRQAAIGALVTLIGVVVAYAVPALLA